MVKVSREQMNKDEKIILAELQKNAQESIDRLAKQCGFSRQKVWRIVKRLEKNRSIWGYSAIIDEKKNGLNHYTLLIKRTTKKLDERTIDIITSRKLEDLVGNIGATIENSYYVNGEYDWVITFTALDIVQAKKFCESLLALHPGVIEKTILLEMLFFMKNHYILNPESKKLRDFL
jgi:Lrp/AsnC family leucine-responsive transcriptional regulator